MESLSGTSVCPICGIDQPHNHSADEMVKYRNSQKAARFQVEDHSAFIEWQNGYYENQSPIGGWEAWLAAKIFYYQRRLDAQLTDEQIREIAGKHARIFVTIGTTSSEQACYNAIREALGRAGR